MKRKFTWLLAVSAAVLGGILSGCGNNPATTQRAPAKIPSTFSNASPPPGSGSLPTGGVSNTSTCSKSGTTGAVKEFQLSGSGPVTDGSGPFTGTVSGIDNLLKVQIIPGTANTNSGNGGTQQYTLMAVDVSVYQNGNFVSTYSFPGELSSDSKAAGIPVGWTYTRDLSGVITQAHSSFTFQIANVKTDAKCNTLCGVQGNQAAYCFNPSPYDCNRWSYQGYGWYTDHLGVTGCCMLGILNGCFNNNCYVASANSTASWTVTVRVETDNSGCL